MSDNFLGKIGKIFGKDNPSWEEVVMALLDPGDPRTVLRPVGDDWLCPFTGKRVYVPQWDGSSLTLLQQPEVIEHLHNIPDLEKKGLKTPVKTWEELVQLMVLTRLREAPNYRVGSEKGEWICPHCGNNTGILLYNWDGTQAPLSWFMPEAIQHLQSCQAYLEDPLGARSYEDLASSKTAGTLRGELLRRVSHDPVFRVTDETGVFICPFAERPIESINLNAVAWGPAIREVIVAYLLSPECPGRFQKWKTRGTVDDLKRIAERINMQRATMHSKHQADKELHFMRQRLDRLAQTASAVKEIQRDLIDAREAQLKMLPEKPPKIEGYDVAGFYEPSSAIGGDFYHFFDVGPGLTGFLIGDVSGHGVQAAMIMSMVLKSFQVRSAGAESAAQVIGAVNRDIYGDMQRGKFVTAFYAILEQQTGKLRFSRAGHPPAILLNPIDNAILALEGGGQALGIGTPDAFDSQLQEFVVDLPRGGMVLLYTDGATEAMNAEKEEFSEARLAELVRTYSDLPAGEAIGFMNAAVRAHTNGLPLADDMTLVLIKRILDPNAEPEIIM